MHAQKWTTARRCLAVILVTLAVIAVAAPWMPWMSAEIGTQTENGICVGVSIPNSEIPVCREVQLTGKELAEASAQSANSLPATFGLPTASLLMVAFSVLGVAALASSRSFIAVIAMMLYWSAKNSVAETNEFLIEATTANASLQTDFGIGATLMLADSTALISALAAIALVVISTGMFFAVRADRLAAGEVRENKWATTLTSLVATRMPRRNEDY